MTDKKVARTNCRKGHELAVTGFWWSYDGKGCLFRQCSECTRERQRKWRVENPDRRKEASRRRTIRRRMQTGVIRLSRIDREMHA